MSAAASARKQEPSIVAGEYRFTAEDFRRIAEFLYADSGIHLPQSKTALVYSRLAKRLRLLGLESFRDYCNLVSKPEGAEERRSMMAALTTNLTRFFREPHHFDHLKETVLEPLAEAARRGARVRLWSAGCSTGQEPYSLALTVLSVLPEAPELDFRILATDIDPNVVQTARTGVYEEEAVSPIPSALRTRWLSRVEDAQRPTYRVGDAPRSFITFAELNLMGPWPMKGKFDAIFCRNVAIYFDDPTQERLWSRFGDQLTDDGRLYIGHSERIGSDRFETDGVTTYRLRQRGRR